MWGATPSRIGAGETLTPKFGDVGEFDAAIRFNPNGFREVFADFVFVNFKSCDEADVPDVVAAEVDVHQAWD